MKVLAADVWMDGRLVLLGCMDVWLDGWLDGCSVACLLGCLDGCIAGWLDGWMHGSLAQFEVMLPLQLTVQSLCLTHLTATAWLKLALRKHGLSMFD